MKKELRKNVLQFREKLTTQVVQAKSELIAKRLFAIREFKESQVVMLYLDFRNEAATGLITKKCFEEGKRVVIPVTQLKPPRLIPSELINLEEDLSVGTYGIMEPKKDKVRPIDVKQIDLVIVPGVAFDANGNRLGYGGGFYDRFLPETNEDTVFIALAYDFQVVDDVYPEAHDYQVHYLITEKQVIDCKNK